LTFRLTEHADRDIANILRDTYRLFGRNQVVRYAGIIERGIAMVAEDPSRASSRERPELKPDLRSFHLRLASERSRGAAHVLYYRINPRDRSEVVVLRVLAEEMEPKRRVAQALRDSERS
jgi:toxin ParE1/3/4